VASAIMKMPKQEFATPYLYNQISTSGLSQKQKASSRPHFWATHKIWWKIGKELAI